MTFANTNTYAPNRIAPLKQATRDMFNSLHKQYPIALTLTLKQSFPITNAYGSSATEASHSTSSSCGVAALAADAPCMPQGFL